MSDCSHFVGVIINNIRSFNPSCIIADGIVLITNLYRVAFFHFRIILL